MTPKLEARGVSIAFGGVQAVAKMSLRVEPGEAVGLMGPNGAGKTTFFEILSGFLQPDEGQVLLDGVDVTTAGVHERARLGVARGFQDAGLYASMLVEDVLRLSLDRHVADRTDLAASLLNLRSARMVERWIARRADELVERFGLRGYRDSAISELSTGTRRVVEIAAVIAQEPTLVLFDEPTAGVAQKEGEALRRLLVELRQETGMAILLIEHDVPMLMELSERLYVMEAGTLLAEGPPEQVRADDRVLEAYFGVRPHEVGHG